MYQRAELDYLIYNDPEAYAELILNGNPKAYLETVTEYKPWTNEQRPPIRNGRWALYHSSESSSPAKNSSYVHL